LAILFCLMVNSSDLVMPIFYLNHRKVTINISIRQISIIKDGDNYLYKAGCIQK
jgi:hypothetical protein